jgi:hypothetical protein
LWSHPVDDLSQVFNVHVCSRVMRSRSRQGSLDMLTYLSSIEDKNNLAHLLTRIGIL